VPTWDRKTKRVINNESSEIIRMLNSEFNGIAGDNVDFYPLALRNEIDRINDLVYANVNNGVYRCGFAHTQEAYEAAYDALFATLDELEARLGRQRYLVGRQITEADWRLFPTLARFDVAYFSQFKCNKRRIADYANLLNYMRELYQVPGVAATVKPRYYVITGRSNGSIRRESFRKVRRSILANRTIARAWQLDSGAVKQQEETMPRLRYIEENEKIPYTHELIESAKRTGAPDPRVVSLMTRSKLGIAWVEYWNKLLYQGVLPHKLKEMCRIKISVAHQCGYCSTVRSNVAKAEGLTESMINDLFDHAGSQKFSAREKAALHYAGLFKQGEHAIDKDDVYAELAKHFSDEEIIELGLFCAEVDGVGKFVKSLNVLSWEEACELNPKLGTTPPPRVAAE
jgi:AhpD family alkylhydroperoxidase